MRILFICSSLEPGRDGVGDYTRSLAEECVCQGHACALIALNERHLEADTAPERYNSAGNIFILHLPERMPWPKRVAKATAFRTKFQPDIVSLQFVCYGFHRKGLVWNLWRHLRQTIGGLPLHVMFHELWIGVDVGARIRHRIVGILQRTLVLHLLHRLHPSAVSTSNGTYVAMLKRHGISANRLPLFGSIPIDKKPDDEWLLARCATAQLGVEAGNRNAVLIFGMFATLHPGWPPDPLFALLKKVGAACGKRVIVASIGRMGVAGERLWEEFSRSYKEEIGFLKLGEQPVERVSNFFQWIDYGIAASSWEVIGKSSAVAAMIEHGLVTLVNRDDWHLRGEPVPENETDPLLFRLDETLEAKLIAGLPKCELASRLPQIACDFMETVSRIRI